MTAVELTITQTPSRRRKVSALTLGTFILVTLVALALLAPLIFPGGPNVQQPAARLLPPWSHDNSGAFHLLGTDGLGRDLLVRVIYGARSSLFVAAVGVAVGSAVGVVMGLIAGYYGGWSSSVIMRTADIQLAFPYLLLALAVVAVLGANLANLVLVLGLTTWVSYARLIRGQVLGIREREFVAAAKALGVSDLQIIRRHVLPHVLSPLLIITSVEAGRLILLEATLSFLGLGVQPPTPAWGADLAAARQYITVAWWVGTFPGVMIVIAVLATYLIGDGLRNRFDPWQHHAR
ncbi:ABC transporter permease [Kribbella sp. NPDC050820]|uniref:ABC transporter permease n=1 Tax=Kribbella sp. NPDC050820 TaxID=3155408 RepID=UPI0033C456E0